MARNTVPTRAQPEQSAPAIGKRSAGLPRELLDVAAQAFSEQGYVAASLNGIAERFGVLKGSLYHYINSKDDLLFAIIRDSHEWATANNVRWRSEDDPLRAIALFVEDHIRTALDNVVYTLVYTREYRRLSTERRRQLTAKRSAYERDLRNLIAAAKKHGEVRADVDPKLATLAIFGLVNWVYAWHGTDGFDEDDIVVQLRRQALALLTAPD